MPGPNLHLPTGEVDGVLNKYTVKLDGDAFEFTVDLVFKILNSKEAEELDKFFPGARQTYIACTENTDDWKEKRDVTPSFESELSVELAAKESGRSLVKGTAQVPLLSLRASKKVVTLTVRLKLTGQPENVAANLTHGMKTPVSFIWDAAQQSLFKPKTDSLIPEKGQIICYQGDAGPAFGQAIEISDEDGVLVSDFGTDNQVAISDIVSIWTVNLESPEYDKMIKSYQDRCKRRQIPPTWEFLTQAVGEAFGQDGQPGQGAHVLTKDIIARAVALGEAEAKANEVPDNVVPLSEAVGQA
jgi:hypothetical protein